MGWPGHLALNYRRDGERTVLHDRHSGPLRVLQSLYPEAAAVCHNVLVHPPGGIVGGDDLVIDARLQASTHALITTPGATRFYRSTGQTARQSLAVTAESGARLEWLPLETIVHGGARAENRLQFNLSAGAEMLGWDVLALGLPASGDAFAQGHVRQQIELPGVWLERACIEAGDAALLDSPLGWAGRRVMATLWFGAGERIDTRRADQLLTAARAAVGHDPDLARIGITAPNEHTVVLRMLAPHTESALSVLQRVWRAWRMAAWQLTPRAPRVWRM